MISVSKIDLIENNAITAIIANAANTAAIEFVIISIIANIVTTLFRRIFIYVFHLPTPTLSSVFNNFFHQIRLSLPQIFNHVFTHFEHTFVKFLFVYGLWSGERQGQPSTYLES